MDINQESLELHYQMHGKIEVISRKKIETRKDLSLLYTPGVAEPCRQIAKDYEKSFELTRRNNLVAVITDGTAVLGLGDIGPAAGMPVMEGDIPLYHDDQHGTAIVVAAALINACKVTGKKMGKLRVVINGAGAAGIAIGKLLISMGFGNIIMCDINGIICEGDSGLNPGQEEISHISNQLKEHGLLADAMKGADAFIGVSRPGLVSKEMVASMNQGIVFAMANPTPEIMPDEALEAGAAVL